MPQSNLNNLRQAALATAALVALAILVGCGSQAGSTGNFGGTSGPALTVSEVSLSPASVTGGTSTDVTVTLADPAPEGGVNVQLTSSDATVVTLPQSVTVPAGQSSAVVAATTSAVSAATTVSISALYNGSIVGTSLGVTPATSSTFTIALTPNSDTIAPGHNGSLTVTTTVPSGYKHALTLTATNLPSGISATFSPATIPSPGGGTSKSVVAVQGAVAVGTYTFYVKASDGTTNHSAKLTLKVAVKNPEAKFHGCWYHSGGNKYQGVDLSVGNPGTYAFNATLYYGASCNPNNWADEFGYGTPLSFGNYDYTFWFADFKNQAGTSARWQIGSDSSVCVNYETAPDC